MVVALVICQFAIIPVLAQITANSLRRDLNESHKLIADHGLHMTTVYKTSPIQ